MLAVNDFCGTQISISVFRPKPLNTNAQTDSGPVKATHLVMSRYVGCLSIFLMNATTHTK